MFRATLLSIALTLTAGPTAITLLCAVWCHQQVVSSDTCEHEGAASETRRVTEDRCADTAAGAAALIREDQRRLPSAPDGSHAVVAVPPRLAPPAAPGGIGREPARHGPLEARPLLIALRI